MDPPGAPSTPSGGGGAGAKVTRAEIAEKLRAWQAGEVDAPSLQAWAQAALEADDPDPIIREVLGEIDFLQVWLLLPEDAPALIEFVEAGEPAEGLAAWLKYRDAIDLDSRSRLLKRDRFYRPFCR